MTVSSWKTNSFLVPSKNRAIYNKIYKDKSNLQIFIDNQTDSKSEKNTLTHIPQMHAELIS